MVLATINGIEFAAKLEASSECVRLELVCAVDGKFKQFDCLVPHGLEDRKWGDRLTDNYKIAAIAKLESWFADGLFFEKDYDGSLRYQPEFRGYANLPNFTESSVKGVHEVDRVSIQMNSESFSQVLRYHHSQEDVWYLSRVENQQIKKIRAAYIDQNQAYIDSKAKEFAEWWASKVGAPGHCGDPWANILHAMATKDKTFEQSDVEKFAGAVYQYALAEFSAGRIPFLSCDYGPEREIREMLTANNIENLAARMPWKTWLHLDFSDMPPIVSEVGVSK